MVFKVGSDSNVPKTSISIYKYLKENPNEKLEVQAIAAGAVNQAVKAIARATRKFAGEGITIIASIDFISIATNENPDFIVSGISFIVRKI